MVKWRCVQAAGRWKSILFAGAGASQQSIADYIVEQIEGSGVTARFDFGAIRLR